MLYFIEADDARLVRQYHGKDVYVYANFNAYDDEEDIRNGNGFAETSMLLYKVSEEENQS